MSKEKYDKPGRLRTFRPSLASPPAEAGSSSLRGQPADRDDKATRLTVGLRPTEIPGIESAWMLPRHREGIKRVIPDLITAMPAVFH